MPPQSVHWRWIIAYGPSPAPPTHLFVVPAFPVRQFATEVGHVLAAESPVPRELAVEPFALVAIGSNVPWCRLDWFLRMHPAGCVLILGESSSAKHADHGCPTTARPEISTELLSLALR